MTNLFAQIEQQLVTLDEQNLRRRRRISASPCGPKVMVDGQHMLTFCSFDYLGLATHPQIQSALQEGVSKYGVGSGASHLISGHSLAHEQLEERLAALLSPHLAQARALYFGTGYMANLAVLPALAALSDDAEIFSEKLNHASLIDAAKLARSKVSIYPHLDLTALEGLLQQSKAKTKIVVTDGVFSMDGVIAPLSELIILCEHYGAWLMVDDAHGFGVLGNGAGILAHFNVCSKQLIYMGTLGKAAGVSGAFVAAHAQVIEWLIQKARTYIYTTASPPALAHALLTSLDIICGKEGAQRRAHLQNLIMQFKSSLKDQLLLNSETQIQPFIVGKNSTAIQLAAQLYEAGIWVPAIRPPTVPAGSARLRISLSAAHSSAQVDCLSDELHRFQKASAETYCASRSATFDAHCASVRLDFTAPV